MNAAAKPSAALRALLAGTVDYAGLFPPASLALAPALQNHASYVRSSDAWMLGAFVLPFGKFDEAAGLLAPFDVEHRLRISALGPKTDNPAAFLEALTEGSDAIRAFNTRYGATASITQIEIALPAQPGVTARDAYKLISDLGVPTFFEAEANEAERVIASLADYNRTTYTGTFGFKLRTGGVIASAFPSSIQIARALVAACACQVPIKFTAGLHHPVRQFHASVQTKMHGFLNVLGAGVLGAVHGWDVQQTAMMLEEEDGSAFTFDDEDFTWREAKIATAQIHETRKLVTSFGSCSFDEPREDLRALNLL